ncbi:hypothetical protein OIV83_003077 [Microbotryomycetes sp. JL201]|nr:hypothetical protein OIV83_003077 [Microbotryomycetes sp. JL201]
MYNPVRGGTRGGQGDFKWSDVAADKDRENYLGHSVMAPVGRWQANKDVTWYNKDAGSDEQRRRDEITKIKQAEEDALALALYVLALLRLYVPLRTLQVPVRKSLRRANVIATGQQPRQRDGKRKSKDEPSEPRGEGIETS